MRYNFDILYNYSAWDETKSHAVREIFKHRIKCYRPQCALTIHTVTVEESECDCELCPTSYDCVHAAEKLEHATARALEATDINAQARNPNYAHAAGTDNVRVTVIARYFYFENTTKADINAANAALLLNTELDLASELDGSHSNGLLATVLHTYQAEVEYNVVVNDPTLSPSPPPPATPPLPPRSPPLVPPLTPPFPPPLPPPSPPPSPPPLPPPSPPPTSPPNAPSCNIDSDTTGQDQELFESCLVNVNVVPCEVHYPSDGSLPDTSLFMRTCLLIDRPFYMAFVGGTCVHDHSETVGNDVCFESMSLATQNNPPTVGHGYMKYVSIYQTHGGMILSSYGKEYWGNKYYYNAPATSVFDRKFALVVKQGYTFKLDHSVESEDNIGISHYVTEIYASPWSRYTLTNTISPPPPLRPPPSSPPSPNVPDKLPPLNPPSPTLPPSYPTPRPPLPPPPVPSPPPNVLQCSLDFCKIREDGSYEFGTPDGNLVCEFTLLEEAFSRYSRLDHGDPHSLSCLASELNKMVECLDVASFDYSFNSSLVDNIECEASNDDTTRQTFGGANSCGEGNGKRVGDGVVNSYDIWAFMAYHFASEPYHFKKKCSLYTVPSNIMTTEGRDDFLQLCELHNSQCTTGDYFLSLHEYFCSNPDSCDGNNQISETETDNILVSSRADDEEEEKNQPLLSRRLQETSKNRPKAQAMSLSMKEWSVSSDGTWTLISIEKGHPLEVVELLVENIPEDILSAHVTNPLKQLQTYPPYKGCGSTCDPDMDTKHALVIAYDNDKCDAVVQPPYSGTNVAGPIRRSNIAVVQQRKAGIPEHASVKCNKLDIFLWVPRKNDEKPNPCVAKGSIAKGSSLALLNLDQVCLRALDDDHSSAPTPAPTSFPSSSPSDGDHNDQCGVENEFCSYDGLLAMGARTALSHAHFMLSSVRFSSQPDQAQIQALQRPTPRHDPLRCCGNLRCMPHADANVNISVCTSGAFPNAPPAPPFNEDDDNNDNSNGLSNGAIVGIIFGSMFATTLLVCIVVLCVLKNKEQKYGTKKKWVPGTVASTAEKEPLRGLPVEPRPLSLARVHAVKYTGI